MKMYRGTGRRKTAVASVRLVPGKGNLSINKKTGAQYLPVDLQRREALMPLELTDKKNAFDVFVNVNGGGPSGQTGAIQLGIARALVTFDEELKPTLREAGLLTRDPRMVERKKYGQKKARKKFQFSKR